MSIQDSGDLVQRRRMLQALCALAGATATPSLPAPRSVPRKLQGLIDVHHHILPPQASEGMRKLMAGWTAPNTVALMDGAGVATAIAYPGPILSGTGPERGAKARLWNEFGATLGRDYPRRFGLFASLPFPDVDACIAEIDYAATALKADGFGIATSYDERWLGDESLWPIYERLDHLGAVVFVHPHDAACCTAEKLTYERPPMDGSWIEWPMNTARTILSLMASGTLRRFPNIRFIFAHGGGVMPLLVKRLAGFTEWAAVGKAGLEKVSPQGIESEFKKLRFECAQACSRTNMNALRSLVPDSQILFGSDYSFFPLAYATEQLARLELPPAVERAIGHGNAAALLPRWS